MHEPTVHPEDGETECLQAVPPNLLYYCSIVALLIFPPGSEGSGPQTTEQPLAEQKPFPYLTSVCWTAGCQTHPAHRGNYAKQGSQKAWCLKNFLLLEVVGAQARNIQHNKSVDDIIGEKVGMREAGRGLES